MDIKDKAVVVTGGAEALGASLCRAFARAGAAGGVAGVGERRHAIDPQRLRFSGEGIGSDLTAEELHRMPVLGDKWPIALQSASGVAAAAP